MGYEYELKFRATPDALAAMEAAFPGGARISMTTTYYDTPDGALTARRWTLRHRQEGERQVCTLKTPSGDGAGRGEWETECADIHAAVPVLSALSGWGELEALVKSGLEATCGARFQRIAVPLTIGGSTAELALDAGVLVNGGLTQPLCEAEVELKSGSEEEITAFARELAEKFGLMPEPRSKFYRARHLGEG